MNTASRSPAGRGFVFSLRFVSVFAAAHILLVLLQTNFLPLSDDWNVVWLSLELLLAAGALGISAVCLAYARVRGTQSLDSFSALFRDIMTPGTVFLALWVLWAYISCFLAIREGRASFYHNVRFLFYQTADMLVLFPLGLYLGRKSRTSLLKAVYDGALALFTIQLLWGFLRFFGGEAAFSAFYGRPFDYSILRPIIAVNSNSVGGYAAFFLVAGIWRFRSAGSRVGRALLIAAFAVNFAAFVSVESRAAVLGVTAALGTGAGAAFWRRGRLSPLPRAVCSAVCCAVAAAVFLGVFYGSRTAVLRVQNRVLGRIYTAAAEKAPEAVEGSGSPDRPGNGSTSYIAPAPGVSGDRERRDLVGGGASTLGGRSKIWRCVIEGAARDRHILLHGTSMANVGDWVETTAFKRNFHTHNQLLEVLVAQGLPALVLFLLWLVWLAGKSFSLAFSPSPGAEWALPLPLLSLITHNMAEMMLVGRTHFVGGFFFLIAGYTAGLTAERRSVL